jgi:Subtilase family
VLRFAAGLTLTPVFMLIRVRNLMLASPTPTRRGLIFLVSFGMAVGTTHLSRANGGDAAERAREQAHEASERAREQAKQAAERASEQAKKSAEQTSEEARKSETVSKEDGRVTDEDGARRLTQKQPTGNTSAKTRYEDDDRPPTTMLELVRRLVSSPKARPAPLDLPHIPHANTEVLAVGMTSAGKAKARELGFVVGHSSNLARLHMRVTRLIAPAGFDAISARDLLRSEATAEQLALNYFYRPYRFASRNNNQKELRVPGMRRATVGGCDMARCYARSMMNWERQSTTCARNVRVGIIDTSVDTAHPAFKGRNVRIGSFLPSGTTRTVNWHGTGVLAVLGGDPNSGTPGLIPFSDFYVADVYHADNDGQPIADTFSLISALNWMSGEDVKIINMSMSGPHDALLQNAIADLSAKGVLLVAAAGNEGPAAPPSYPAAYPQVIAVTAVGKDFRSYSLANHGEYIDVAAPGIGIWTALPNAMEGYQSGTSFAAPHVTAIIAGMYSRVSVKTKDAFLRQMTFRDLGQPGRDRIYGRGLVLASGVCNGGQWVTEVVRADPVSSNLAPPPAGR